MADEKRTIVVVRRSADYHASIKGIPGCWGCGRSPEEAVGALIGAWPEYFVTKLVYLF